jgi:quinol monooxygenase YgiN
MATSPAEQPSFAVLTVYTSSPEHRQEFVTLIHDFARALAMTHPGLCAFDMFTDETNQHIVTLARWRDRSAFEEFKRSESGIQGSQVALVLKPTVYFLHPEATLAEAEMVLRRAG